MYLQISCAARWTDCKFSSVAWRKQSKCHKIHQCHRSTYQPDRIHVDWAIQRVKWYEIVDHVPHKCRPVASKIFQVSAALRNLHHPLIQDIEDMVPATKPTPPAPVPVSPQAVDTCQGAQSWGHSLHNDFASTRLQRMQQCWNRWQAPWSFRIRHLKIPGKIHNNFLFRTSLPHCCWRAWRHHCIGLCTRRVCGVWWKESPSVLRWMVSSKPRAHKICLLQKLSGLQRLAAPCSAPETPRPSCHRCLCRAQNMNFHLFACWLGPQGAWDRWHCTTKASDSESKHYLPAVIKSKLPRRGKKNGRTRGRDWQRGWGRQFDQRERVSGQSRRWVQHTKAIGTCMGHSPWFFTTVLANKFPKKLQ